MYRIASIVSAAVVAVALCSCASQRVTYLDPNSNDQKIVTVGKINQQDWGMAASKMIDSLLQNGTLKKPGKKSVVVIGRIKNSTSEHIDTDLLVKKMRVAMLKSGQARVTTAIGVGGPEDTASMKLRKELRGNEEFKQDTIAKKGTLLSADYSLTGKIIESGAKAGRTRQSTFSFQLTLTDVKTGLAEWEDEYEIVKQGNTKSAVGF